MFGCPKTLSRLFLQEGAGDSVGGVGGGPPDCRHCRRLLLQGSLLLRRGAGGRRTDLLLLQVQKSVRWKLSAERLTTYTATIKCYLWQSILGSRRKLTTRHTCSRTWWRRTRWRTRFSGSSETQTTSPRLPQSTLKRRKTAQSLSKIPVRIF